MCGIAGFTLPRGLSAEARAREHGPALARMTASLRHRGPDALNALLLDGVALGHTRLSVVDLEGGHQPMRDPATGVTVVFNGEIFNHVELRERLRARHAFRTAGSDTEVLLAAFLARGIACVEDFVGQFAFALHDPRDGQLWLARDRVGVRPLFLARTGRGLAFASEVKALFAAGWVRPALDARALKETLHLWAPVAPRSPFEGVEQLPPGHVARWDGRALEVRRYWDLDLSDPLRDLTPAQAAGQVAEALSEAVRVRLRADVPVAAYLSGGLDSSLLCALAQEQLGGTLRTFSVRFAQARFDERAFQDQVARELGTAHHSVEVQDAQVAELLPQVVDHAEQVLLRSAPAPFLALSRLVREHRTKVVLTGEGADELFLGYDLFKETKVRQFWARRPQSAARARLLTRLYPYLPLSAQGPELLRRFYGLGLDRPDALGFGHAIRWSNSGRVARFLSAGFLEGVAAHVPEAELAARVPARVHGWGPLQRAQYLEVQTLLSGYLLGAQGDRMLMGSSVEGRYPFLDHRVIELAARLPAHVKLRGLDEKHVLKRVARGRVPERVLARPKFPYRAPVAEALVSDAAPAWTRALLSRDAVDAVGVFDGAKVERLVQRLRGARPGGAPPSEADAMALMAAASTQLLHHQLVRPRDVPAAHVAEVRVVAE